MNDKPISILVIEENPSTAMQVLSQMDQIKGLPFYVTQVETLFEGFKILDQQKFDVITMDLVLPDTWGTETYLKLKEKNNRKGTFIPILLMSEEDDEECEKIVFDEGACDFLVKKNISADMLSRTIMYAYKLKQTKDSLQESENRFERLVEAAQDLIFITDINGRIKFVNGAFEKILGRNKQEAIGSRFIDYVLPDDRQSFNSSIIQQMRTDEFCVTFEVRVNTLKNEVKFIIFNCTPLKNEKGNVVGIAGIGHDVSSLKSLEQELIARNRELNDFAYMVSHDLKNPIILIKSFLDTIKSDPSMLQEYYSLITDQSNRLINFIDQLLKLSRAGKIIEDRIKIDMEVLIRKVYIIQKSDDIPSELTIKSPIPGIMGDPMKIEQVFTNIIQNSFRYSDKNKDKLIIEVDSHKNEDTIIINIKDNGIGVERQFIEKIFNAGFALKKDKSTGFGLAISRKIVEGHGGTITAMSSGKDQGLEFAIELPRY